MSFRVRFLRYRPLFQEAATPSSNERRWITSQWMSHWISKMKKFLFRCLRKYRLLISRQNTGVFKNMPIMSSKAKNDKLFRNNYSLWFSLKQATKVIVANINQNAHTVEVNTIKDYGVQPSRKGDYICNCNQSKSQSTMYWDMMKEAVKCLWIKTDKPESQTKKTFDKLKRFVFNSKTRPSNLSSDSKIMKISDHPSFKLFDELIVKSEQSLDVVKTWNQLNSDIVRTFPKQQYFEIENKGFCKVYDILKVHAANDKECNYVQGMNFIACALAYHWSAKVSFWLFTHLMQTYKLRENYLKNFQGFYKHSTEISELLETNNIKLFKFIQEFNVSLALGDFNYEFRSRCTW